MYQANVGTGGSAVTGGTYTDKTIAELRRYNIDVGGEVRLHTDIHPVLPPHPSPTTHTHTTHTQYHTDTHNITQTRTVSHITRTHLHATYHPHAPILTLCRIVDVEYKRSKRYTP